MFEKALEELGEARADGLCEIVRELTHADLQALANRPKEPKAEPTASIVKLKSSHHRLAQLVALGHPNIEIAALTGYDDAYISNLGKNPAFRALVAHYGGVTAVAHVEAMDRLRALGIDAIEEIQGRLATEPEEIPTAELREIVKMAIVQPFAAAAKASGEVAAARAPRTFNVSFRSAPGPSGPSGPVIDGEIVQ